VKKTMFMLLSSTVLLATSCSKKNSDPVPTPDTPSIEGYWVGKYNSVGGHEEKISMLFKPGGILRVYAIEYNVDTAALAAPSKITGEWTRVGNTVLTTYKSGSATITNNKVVNAANTQMAGSWALNGSTKGYIELNK
jgi:hypothetical protein